MHSLIKYELLVLWALCSVAHNHSYRSCEDLGDTLRYTCRNDPTLQKFSLGRVKISCTVCFGLTPFIQSSLMKDIGKDKFIVCCDESLNAISQSTQMSINVRYWDSEKNQVVTRYLNSTFLNCTCAKDVVEGLKVVYCRYQLVI